MADNDDGNVRVRAAFLGVVEAAERRFDSHEGEKVFGSEKRETASHPFVTANPGQGEIDGRRVGKNISAGAQCLIFRMRKLPVVMVRILPGRENIHDFRGADPHHRPKHNAVNESEDGGVHPDRERECEDGDDGEPWSLDELPKREFEVLNHFVAFPLRCGRRPIWIQRMSLGT